MATGRIGWAQVGGAAAKGRIGWAQVGVPSVAAKGRIGWAQVGVPSVAAKGRIGWAQVTPVAAPAAYTLECLPGYFESQGAPALADYEMDLGAGVFSSAGQEANLALGADVFKLSATPIGKRLSLTSRPPNLSTRIR